MERLEYTVITRADRELAWKIFSDWRAWRHFSDIYGDIDWLKGEPWKPGSRLRIEILRPQPAVVDHLITVCSPPEFVAWIDHACFNTMEQWVTFHALPDGGTRIHTWAELTGNRPMVAGQDIRGFVREFLRAWYESFAAACDGMAQQEVMHV